MRPSDPTLFCSPFQGVAETLTGVTRLPAAATADDHFLWRAAQQADLGQGRCSPNPPVGAVVVRDGVVVGEGFHARAGGAHGEVEALDRAGANARGATLYVTLEPCNHHGRTGPCTERILAEGIRRVVVGVRDPNPHVVGNGMARLSSEGVEVSLAQGPSADRCAALIAPFAKNSLQQAPWVVAKVAASLDGRVGKPGVPRFPITGPVAQNWVHTLRDRVDAILVGAGTTIGDDPSLSVRHEIPERPDAKNPVRFVIDSALRTSPRARVYQRQERDPEGRPGAYVVHIPGLEADVLGRFDEAGVQRIEVPPDAGQVSIPALWAALSRLGLTSVLVEPGPRLFRALIDHAVIDELWWFQAPVLLGTEALHILGAGLPAAAPVAAFAPGVQTHPTGEDWLRIGTLA